MGRLYVASVLMSISTTRQPSNAPDTELKPMTPGAWAAWARDWDAQQAALTAGPRPEMAPTTTTLRPVGSKA